MKRRTKGCCFHFPRRISSHLQDAFASDGPEPRLVSGSDHDQAWHSEKVPGSTSLEELRNLELIKLYVVEIRVAHI